MVSNYNELFLDHFQNPRNIGKLDDYDASFESVNESDSDKIKFFIKIQDNILSHISYLVKGCRRIIASCSYISEIVKGMKIGDIKAIDKGQIRNELGFSDEEFLCIDLPLHTILQAIKESEKGA